MRSARSTDKKFYAQYCLSHTEAKKRTPWMGKGKSASGGKGGGKSVSDGKGAGKPVSDGNDASKQEENTFLKQANSTNGGAAHE